MLLREKHMVFLTSNVAIYTVNKEVSTLTTGLRFPSIKNCKFVSNFKIPKNAKNSPPKSCCLGFTVISSLTFKEDKIFCSIRKEENACAVTNRMNIRKLSGSCLKEVERMKKY